MYDFSLVLDIDETIINPLHSWAKFIEKNLELKPTIEELTRIGSVQEYVVSQGVPKEHAKILEYFRSSSEFNAQLPSVDGALSGVNEVLSGGNILFSGYLTARPRSISNVTEENLRKNGFPEGKVVFCGSQEGIIDCKARYLIKIMEKSRLPLVYVDDNIDLISALSEFDDIYPFSALGPFREYQINRADELGITNLCVEWKDLAKKIKNI